MEILPSIPEEADNDTQKISDDLKDFTIDLFKDYPELLGHILDPNSEWTT